MTGGSSGGPWLRRSPTAAASAPISGVNSYGYSGVKKEYALEVQREHGDDLHRRQDRDLGHDRQLITIDWLPAADAGTPAGPLIRGV